MIDDFEEAGFHEQVARDFSEEKFPGRVLLRCGASASRTGGTSFIAFVPHGEAVEIWHSTDLDAWAPSRAGRLPGPASFRDMARWLMSQGECSAGGDPEDVDVEGVTGAWAEMLAVAWTRDEEEIDLPTANASALMTLDDDSLDALSRTYGPLSSSSFRSQLSGVLDRAAALGLEEVSLAELLRRASAREPCDLDALGEKLREGGEWEIAYGEQQARGAEERAIADEKRRRMLEPFRSAIDAAMKSWALPRSDRWGEARARRSAVQRFTEDYVVATGELPSGVHQVEWVHLNSKRQIQSIDFTKLFTSAS